MIFSVVCFVFVFKTLDVFDGDYRWIVVVADGGGGGVVVSGGGWWYVGGVEFGFH